MMLFFFFRFLDFIREIQPARENPLRFLHSFIRPSEPTSLLFMSTLGKSYTSHWKKHVSIGMVDTCLDGLWFIQYTWSPPDVLCFSKSFTSLRMTRPPMSCQATTLGDSEWATFSMGFLPPSLQTYRASGEIHVFDLLLSSTNICPVARDRMAWW